MRVPHRKPGVHRERRLLLERLHGRSLRLNGQPRKLQPAQDGGSI
jgi:hypothetical protein